MFWIITAVLTFLWLRWLVIVPCITDSDSSNTYEPIGMKVWILIAIALISICLVLNIAVLIVSIGGFIVFVVINEIDMIELFPKGPGKVMTFLTKDLSKKK